MSSTYSGNPAASALDYIRYKIDDVATPFLLTDAEILAEAANVAPLYGAYRCAQKIATRYAKRVTKSVGQGQSINYSDLSKQWRQVAEDLLKELRQANMATYPPTIEKVLDSEPQNIPSRTKPSDIEQQPWSNEPY